MTDLSDFMCVSRNNEFASKISGSDHALPHPQQGGPCLASRALAMAQIAMSDVYNSIKNVYTRYTAMPSFPGGDVGAAVAQANHDVLVALFSLQQAEIDATLATMLSSIPDGNAKTIGIAAGAKAAQLILALRTGDGSAGLNGTAPPTNTTTNPGVWSQAPPDSNAAGSTAYGANYGANCKPFVATDTAELISLFSVPTPPDVTTNEYLASFNDQKSTGGVGDATSPSTRTQDQYESAIFWGYDGTRILCAPPTLYNAIIRQIMTQHQKTAAELMRALALCNVAMAEAGIACWYWKYVYNYWRPITAIRYTGSGTNPAAIPQTDWLCLGAPASNDSNAGENFTPPFPSYPSGHG
jgi:hypothetical protein